MGQGRVILVDKHTNVLGATTAEMMVIDSATNEVLAAGEDDMAADFGDRFTKWGSVEEAFEFWGERLAKRLDRFTKRK